MMRVAHRGGSAPLFPSEENAESAFRLALSYGADAVEFDVHLLSDGTPVVFHDPTVDRLTDGHGPISALDEQRLQKLSLRKTRERIPLLSDVFCLLKGRCKMFVELKEGNPGIAARAAAVADELGVRADVLFLSFHRPYLDECRALGYPICPLLSASDADQLGDVLAARPEFVGLEASAIDEEIVSRVRAAGCKLNVWTVNSPAEIERFRRMGIDALTSDLLDLFRT